MPQVGGEQTPWSPLYIPYEQKAKWQEQTLIFSSIIILYIGRGKPSHGRGKPSQGRGQPSQLGQGTRKPSLGLGKPSQGTRKPGQGRGNHAMAEETKPWPRKP